MNEEHEGRRKNELTWKINRIHWEKNRFIYDLMYSRKVRTPFALEAFELLCFRSARKACRKLCLSLLPM